MPCLACAFAAVTNAREGSRPVRLIAFADIGGYHLATDDVVRNDSLCGERD